MKSKELVLLICPLLTLLIGIIVYELRSGLIPDKIVMPAAFYFLAVMGAALGLILALQVAGVFMISAIIVFIIAYFVFSEKMVPSSPIILFSVIIVLGFNFRHRILSKLC